MPLACLCMCLPDTLSRASLLLGLVSLITLAASVATDHWLYTTEPVSLPNATTSATLRVRSGLWRACPSIAIAANTSVNAVPVLSCIRIPYFSPEVRLLRWTDVPLSNPFLNRMRLCVPFLITSLAFLAFGTLVSLKGHIYADNRTFVAAIIFILAGLTLGGAMVLYITMISDEIRSRTPWDAPLDPRYTYRYGWSFLGGAVAFLTAEVAAAAGVSAYLRRFPTPEDIARIVPGMHRKMRHHNRRRGSSSKSSEPPPVPKRDMTVQTFDSIAVPV